MPEIVETCPCGAEFRYKGLLLPDGLGDAIADFRNRHATCRGKVIVPRKPAGPTPAQIDRLRMAGMTQRMDDPYCAGHKHSPGPDRVRCSKCGRYKPIVPNSPPSTP